MAGKGETTMNIAQHVERAAKFYPERTAILFEDAAWSYRELDTYANRLANGLKANGIVRGDRVALYLPNIPQFAASYCAILKAGAIAVSINAIFKSEEVRYILNDSSAKMLFTTGDLMQYVPRAECPALQEIVMCAGDAQGSGDAEYPRHAEQAFGAIEIEILAGIDDVEPGGPRLR